MKNKLFFLLMLLLTTGVSIAQWQSDVRLTNQSASSFTPFNYKSVAANGSVVHVVLYDERDGNFEIYYKRSTNEGISWGTDTRLTINPGTSWFSSVAINGSEVHIIWMDDRDGNFEIYYKRSTDEGLSWSGDTRLTNNTATSQFPSIGVSASVVNVIWQDSRDGNTEIYNKRSADGGISWGADLRLTNNSSGSIFASVSSSGLIVNVFWEEYRDGNGEIYNKHSTNGGLSWSADTRLTNNPSISFSPSAWVSGLEVHVVWYDRRDANIAEIYYKRSSDGGSNWGADTRLTNNFGGSFHPSVSASGKNVHVLWYDDRDGNEEIYYKRSLNGGLSWGLDTRLTNNSSQSVRTSVAVSGQSVHAIWQDMRDGNWEIYYDRNPTGNPVPVTLCFITVIPEGFYDSVTNKLREDTLKAYLRNVIAPYNIVDSAKTAIDSVTFRGLFTFITVPSGNYYIALTHRNSLETWSRSGGETITSGDTNFYDFTASISQAFGNNMIQKGTKFCIYSGDVDQDGIIDGTDGGITDNDAFNFLTGYVRSDVNGDGIVDGNDNSIVDNHASNFVAKITP